MIRITLILLEFTRYCVINMNIALDTSYRPLTDKQLLSVLSVSPVPYAIYTTGQFVIESANPGMLDLWEKDLQVIGAQLSTVFHEYQHKALYKRLRTVWKTGISYTSESDISLQTDKYNRSETALYKVCLEPQKNRLGEVFCVLHTATLISNGDTAGKYGHRSTDPAHPGNLSFGIQRTRSLSIKRKTSTLDGTVISSDYKKLLIGKDETRKNEESLRTLVMNAHYGLLIISGKDWIIEVVNSVITDLWGKKVDDVLGMPLMKVLPNLKDQPFPMLMRQVYESGMPYGQEEEVYLREGPRGLIPRYINFYYDPIFDQAGVVTGIVVSAEDTTEMVLNRKLLENSLEEQQCLVEELNASNEELADSNNSLIIINLELKDSKNRLEQLIKGLEESELRFKNLVEEAPVPICILTGPFLIIESANKMMLQLLGKSSDILHTPIREALPEILDQPFLQQLEQVFQTGITYSGIEEKAYFEHEGVQKEFFFNIIFKPLKNISGQIVVGVQDQGIGIKTDDQLQIFQRYYRVDSNENNVISGFGIGLYLCNEILERHHGTLYVESIIDQGSTFYFSLPINYSLENPLSNSLSIENA